MSRKIKQTPQPSSASWFSPARLGISALVVVAAVVIYAIWQSYVTQTERAKPIEGIVEVRNAQGEHKEGDLSFSHTPPLGGEHNPAWQNCGVYAQPIADENAVHSLEHGAIWITYRPDLPVEQVEALQTLTRQSNYRLLSPYPDLPSPIVASAWGYQLTLDTVDDPRLARFIAKYEQNPFGPEPGAACTSGVGTPG